MKTTKENKTYFKKCNCEYCEGVRRGRADAIKEIKKLLNIPLKKRTRKQHLKLAELFGGVREYMLSMGEFKDVDIDGFLKQEGGK